MRAEEPSSSPTGSALPDRSPLPSTLGRWQRVVRWIRREQRTPEVLDQLQFLITDLSQTPLHPLEAPVAAHPLRHTPLVAGRHMDLALAVSVGGSQVLRDVPLSPSTAAARIAADPRPGPKAAPDQWSVLLQEALDLLAMLLLGLEQPLAQPAGAFAHTASLLLPGTHVKNKSVPDHQPFSHLGNEREARSADAQLPQRVSSTGWVRAELLVLDAARFAAEFALSKTPVSETAA